jgi:hypothetical protein
MKTPALIVTGLILFGCGVKNETGAEDDTVSHYDTTAFIDEDDSVYATPADAPDIRSAVESLIDAQKSRSSRYFTLRLSASGYEYQTDEVWSFDSLMTLVHCYQDWTAEGREGNSHHFFRQDKLYAVKDESGTDSENEISIYHAELGGIAYTEPTNNQDTTFQTLDKKYLASSETDLKTRFAQIVTLLRDNQKNFSTDDPVTLHIENDSADEEMPGKETTEITVDRKLLEKLLK